ncbi:HDOD domain-containing protein [Gemmatimonadota bacterium]
MENKTKEKIQDVLGEVKELPTLPTIVTEIHDVTSNPKTCAAELGELISRDLVIAAEVLKVVNSAYYALLRSITTIKDAIVMMGFESVRNLAISVALVDKFGHRGKVGQFDRGRFWEHSLGVGVMSKIIARKVGYSKDEGVFIAGLLHDIGKVILDLKTPYNFMEVIDMTFSRDILLSQAEKEVYGFTHAEVGQWLGEQWHLPESFCQTMGFHHNPRPILATADFDMTAIVHIADIFARAIGIGSGGDNRIPKVNSSVWMRYQDKLTDDLPGLFDEIQGEMTKAEVFLSLLK